mmetsp:Transcript_36178/g.94754  ORF Transcript_36178/g.94754 Transcript_36178/m.94754 type:complete len:279 (-) Transcript_36178:1672-2508(-)
MDNPWVPLRPTAADRPRRSPARLAGTRGHRCTFTTRAARFAVDCLALGGLGALAAQPATRSVPTAYGEEGSSHDGTQAVRPGPHDAAPAGDVQEPPVVSMPLNGSIVAKQRLAAVPLLDDLPNHRVEPIVVAQLGGGQPLFRLEGTQPAHDLRCRWLEIPRPFWVVDVRPELLVGVRRNPVLPRLWYESLGWVKQGHPSINVHWRQRLALPGLPTCEHHEDAYPQGIQVHAGIVRCGANLRGHVSPGAHKTVRSLPAAPAPCGPSKPKISQLRVVILV